MFGMGMPEILLILALALIVIGPKKLPDLAKALGRAFGEFKRATNDLKQSIDIDPGFKDVKNVFSEMNNEIKESVYAKSTSESAQNVPPGDEPASSTAAPAQDDDEPGYTEALEKVKQAMENEDAGQNAGGRSSEGTENEDGLKSGATGAGTKTESPSDDR